MDARKTAYLVTQYTDTETINTIILSPAKLLEYIEGKDSVTIYQYPVID